MARNHVKHLLAFFAMLAMLIVGPPLHAQTAAGPFAPGSVCLAELPAAVPYGEIARDGHAWKCGTEALAGHERVAVRFDLRDLAPGTAPPDHLRMTRLHFERIEVLVEAADGSTARRMLGRDDLLPGHTLLDAAIALPHTQASPVAVVLIVEGAPSVERLRFAELGVGPPFRLVAGLDHLLAALLCGLLLAPLFFDIGFYRTLRNPFPLFHGAFCLLAMTQTATFSGLLILLTDLSIATQRVLSILTFDLMVAANSLFIASFVESYVFKNWHLRLLYAMAGLSVALGLFASFALPLLGPVTSQIYYAGYLLYFFALATILVRALRMGSRAMLFILLAHLPLLLIGISRVAVGLVGPADYEFDTYWAQNLALAFEVVVTAYAVADRFLTIKRERDVAWSQRSALEKLATHDPLTGLLNRRAIDEQFVNLHRAGYETFALLDLDRFKAVNDACGHQVGDAVLQSCAAALKTDPDVIAIRMGGEEFLLLLRGKNGPARAEKLRQAISLRVAREIVGLESLVTASMGMVTFPHAVMPNAQFADIYVRADKLLYEAKEMGRNRTVSETLRAFRHRGSRDRRAAA